MILSVSTCLCLIKTNTHASCTCVLLALVRVGKYCIHYTPTTRCANNDNTHAPMRLFIFFLAGANPKTKNYRHVVIVVFVSSAFAAQKKNGHNHLAEDAGDDVLCVCVYVWWAHFCVVCSFARSNFKRIEPRLTHRQNVLYTHTHTHPYELLAAANPDAQHIHTHTLGIKLRVNTILTCKSLMSDGFECGLCACMCPAFMWCQTRLNVTHSHTHMLPCVFRPRLLRAFCERASAEVFAAQVNGIWSFRVQ